MNVHMWVGISDLRFALISQKQGHTASVYIIIYQKKPPCFVWPNWLRTVHSTMENLLPREIPYITFYYGSSPEKNAVAAMPACIAQSGSLGWLWLDPRLQGGVGSALHPRVQTQVAAVPAVQGHVVLSVGSEAQEGQTERLCLELSCVASSGFSG